MDSILFLKRLSWTAGTLATASTLTLTGCSSSSSSATDLADAVPLIGITSPTAEATSTAAARAARASRSSRVNGSGHSSAVEADTKPPSATEAKADLAAILAATDATKCFDGIVFQSASPSVDCYGPSLVYSNHPGGTPTMGGTGNGCPAGAYCLPGGDLGIWSAAEASGEACSAAQMNSLTTGVSAMVNTALKLMAGSVCSAQIAGLAKPAAGASVDIKAAIAAALPTATMTSASLGRLADDGANPVYELKFVGSIPGATTATAINLTLRHSPASSSTMKGRLFGTIGLTSDGSYAFAMTYSKVDSAITFVSKSASITKTAADALEFTDGDYDFTGFTGVSGSGTSGNARYLFGSIDESTNTGTIKFAWQAGGNDSKARVFHAHTEAADDGSSSGFAYFGFGPNFSSTSVGEIAGMCCNWAGPDTQATTNVGSTCQNTTYNADNKAQKQVLTRAAGGTTFTASTSNITYAPVHSCSHASATSFKYGTMTQWGADGSAVSAASVTNDLVTYSSASSDYTTYIGALTAPAVAF